MSEERRARKAERLIFRKAGQRIRQHYQALEDAALERIFTDLQRRIDSGQPMPPDLDAYLTDQLR